MPNAIHLNAHFTQVEYQFNAYANACFFIHFFIGFEKIVRKLIENGANVNVVNQESDTALIFGAINGNISNTIFNFTVK